MAKKNEIAKVEANMSERFMIKVVDEFGSGVGDVALTQHQKRLAQNYFMCIDNILKVGEQKRLSTTYKQDPVPLVWANLNMQSLARSVVSCARIGWDALEKNHVHPIPFKNNKTGQYDIVFIPGYNGLEIKAKKYGLDVPDNVVIEVVYSNDTFQILKKDRNNKIEGYDFSVTNPFDRGEIVGGFYYHEFENNPEKNKLVVMSMKDIEKRKPKYASAEFWGGEKDKWVKDEKTGKNVKKGTEQVEGWREQMIYKTIKRAAYSAITIDSQKIDDSYQHLLTLENSAGDSLREMEYQENANSETIEITAKDITESGPSVNINKETGEVFRSAEENETEEEYSGMSSEEADRILAEEESANNSSRKPSFDD